MKQEFTPNNLFNEYVTTKNWLCATLKDLYGIRCEIKPSIEYTTELTWYGKIRKNFLEMLGYDVEIPQIPYYYSFNIWVNPSEYQVDQNLLDMDDNNDGNPEGDFLKILGREFQCIYVIKDKEWHLFSKEHTKQHYLESDSYTKHYIKDFTNTILKIINEQFGTKKQKVAKKSK